MNTLTYLKAQVDAIITTNGARGITAAAMRPFLKNILDGIFTPAGTVRIWPGKTIPTGWSLCNGSELSQEDYADLYAALGGPSSPYGVGSTTFNIPLISPSKSIIQKGIASFAGGYQGDEYTVGDILTAEAPIGGVSATFKVTGVGQAFQLLLLTHGEGYTNGMEANLSGGTGTGASIYITSAYTLGAVGGEEKHILSTQEMPVHTHIQNAHSHSISVYDPNNLGNNVGQGGSVGGAPNNYSTTTVTPTNQNAGGWNGQTQAHNNMSPFMAMNYIIKLY